MWRTHCLRLTRELHAGTRNAPFVPRLYSQDASKAAPISTEDFWEAFAAIWPYPRKADAPKIGLAVSGGVDSMALASLCSSAAKQYDKFPECVGLVVDHKSREGSSEEALWVAEQLRTRAGMSSLILPLQWPDNPNELTDFETQARRLRYRALGLACRDHGLRSILVGHHADDQAETILMRLTAGRVRTGMQGIQAVKEIPECYGLHGVHQSGGLDLLPEPTPEERQRRPIRIESGGIKLIRPLLQFPKERLIATCLGNEMPWAEDKTNHDKTLTERNAIRYVLRSHQLPRALRPESLVNVARRMQQRVEEGRELSEGLLKHCNLRLDVRGGVLRVNFAKARLAIDKLAATDEALAKTLAAQLLTRLVALVSHVPIVRTNRFDTAVESLFPIFQSTEASQPLKPLVVGGVYFFPNAPGQPGKDTKQTFEWTLGRQPYDKRQDAPPVSEIPPRNIDPAVVATNPTSAGYQLFDGRFWVRIVNPTDQPVHLRPLNKGDLPNIKRPLRNIINKVTPGNFRETLPVITKIDTEGVESIIAIPTLGIRLRSRGFVGGIRWTVRYKKIDIGECHLDDVLDSQEIEVEAGRTEKKLGRKDPIMKAQARKPRVIDVYPDHGLRVKKRSHFKSPSAGQNPAIRKRRDEDLIGWQ